MWAMIRSETSTLETEPTRKSAWVLFPRISAESMDKSHSPKYSLLGTHNTQKRCRRRMQAHLTSAGQGSPVQHTAKLSGEFMRISSLTIGICPAACDLPFMFATSRWIFPFFRLWKRAFPSQWTPPKCLATRSVEAHLFDEIV